MSSLLLIISLLLHFVAFYIIYSMFQQIQQLKNNQTTELTDVLESYLQDIKSENDRLQKEINARKNKTGKKSLLPKQNERNKKVESNYSNLDPTDLVDTINDSVETSLEARVIQLHNKGLSNTDIAKQLDCGKTEAELIIQFYREKNKKKT